MSFSHNVTKIKILFHWRQNDPFRHEQGGVAMVAEDVPDGAGGDVCEFLCCRDDNGLDLRSQAAVGIGNGTLVLEIEHIPHTPYDVTDAQIAADIDGESVILNYAYIVEAFGSLKDNAFLLFVGIEPGLVLVHTDSDYYLVEHCQSAPQDVEMSCSERIERSGE